MVRALDMSGFLTGKCLIAMPGLEDAHFSRSVVYLCAHNEEGAMGLVINRPLNQLTFEDVLEQLHIPLAPHADVDWIGVHAGGPVEAARGFILHSTDYEQAATLRVNDAIALTATTDILRSIAAGEGPRHVFMTLGYAGWGAGQLDEEIKGNSWLTVDADVELLFLTSVERRWEVALQKLGIDPLMLSESVGHA